MENPPMMKDMKIGTRLGLAFGTILALMLGVAAVGYWGASSLSQTTMQILQGDAKVSENGAQVRANTLGLRRYEKDLFLNIGSKEKEAEYLKEWAEESESIRG